MDEGTQQIEFTVPNEAWAQAQPPDGTIFLIQRTGQFPHFRPNITGSVAELQPQALLTDAADAVVERLRRFDERAHVAKREESSGISPSVFQLVTFSVRIDDVPVELAQLQTLIEIEETTGQRRSALCIALTAESDALEEYGSDFQDFLTSVRPAT